MRERGLRDLQYYNAEIHGALFVLPNFVRDLTGAATKDATAPAPPPSAPAPMARLAA